MQHERQACQTQRRLLSHCKQGQTCPPYVAVSTQLRSKNSARSAPDFTERQPGSTAWEMHALNLRSRTRSIQLFPSCGRVPCHRKRSQSFPSVTSSHLPRLSKSAPSRPLPGHAFFFDSTHCSEVTCLGSCTTCAHLTQRSDIYQTRVAARGSPPGPCISTLPALELNCP